MDAKAIPIAYPDVILHKTTYTFDVSVWELFWWSINGASVCLLEPGAEKDPYAIVRAVEINRVSVMHFVPSMLNTFLDYVDTSMNPAVLGSLKRVFASGEALSPSQVDLFNRLLYMSNGTSLVNLYGPTEATIDVSYFDCSSGEKFEKIPIGKPIDNIYLYVIGQRLNLQPVGVPGELCIGGVGVARGYLNNPGLTAEKFMMLHHSPLYKTGDLARWLSDGNIEFLGRIDHQVKIRGFRIELGEIENRLLQKEGIENAVAVVKSNETGDKYLCAYFTPSDGFAKNFSVQSLREYMSDTLPEYMVPNYFILLETLPLTISGKVNRKALPEPDLGVGGKNYIAPTNEIEKKLVEIWANVLGLANDKISTGANFFELGGHSLIAIKVIAEIQKKLSVKISLSELFKLSTIKAISEFTRGAKRNIYKPILPSEKKEYYQLTSAQKRMYFVEHITKDSSYNMPVVARIEGNVDKDKLEWAFLKLIERHEGFRTSFEIVKDKLVQIIHPFAEISFRDRLL